MKIEKTNIELDRMFGAIKRIGETNISLPAKAGYMLAKLRIAIENALKPYKESLSEIIKKYSKDDSGMLQVDKNEDPETYQTVCNEINEIGNEVTEVDVTPIPIDYFDGHDIPFAVVDLLSCCFKDSEAE